MFFLFLFPLYIINLFDFVTVIVLAEATFHTLWKDGKEIPEINNFLNAI